MTKNTQPDTPWKHGSDEPLKSLLFNQGCCQTVKQIDMSCTFLQTLVDVSESVFGSHPRFAARLALQLPLHESPGLPRLGQQHVDELLSAQLQNGRTVTLHKAARQAKD